MSNRKIQKDVSDNVIAGAVMASSVLMSGASRIIEAHASDTKKVTVNKGSFEIPVEIGAFWFLVDTATHVDSATDIDTGAVAASTAYYLYAVTDESTISFKTSLSAANPTGYDTAHSKLLGGFTTDGSKDITASTIWDVKMIGVGAKDTTFVAATGTGAPVRATSPTLVTPILGTPTSGTLTNCTGLPLTGLATQPVLTNLLTNSQFMACSGSTLENVGSDLITNGGFASDTTGWTASLSSIASIAGGESGNCLEVTRVSGDSQGAYEDITTVVGKLYKGIGYVKSGTSGNESYIISAIADGVTIITSTTGTSSGSWVAWSIVFEATTTSTRFLLGKNSATAGTMLFDSITLYEVTPGYVAADTLAPDTMTKTSTLDVHQYWNAASANTYGYGTYLAKLTKGADSAEYLNFGSAVDYRQLQNKAVTLGCFVYSVTETDNIKLSIHDGVSEIALSSGYCGANAITWMEVTGTVAANASAITPRILCDGSTGDVAYISQPMFVRGSSIGQGNYQPIPNEEILTEKVIALTGYTATTSAADATINLEAASSGMIGKGAKAVLVKAYGKDSAAGDGVGFDVQSASGVEDGISVDTSVNNVRVQQQGWVKADANGDIYFDHRGSGASALTTDIKIIGIQP